MHSETTTVEGADGTPLTVDHHTPDEGTPVRAVLQVAHGLAEHAARYARFAEAATARGFAVVADDHRGHGRTATRDTVGHFADEDGWATVVDDLARIHAQARSWHPDVPVVVFGHSMGSVLALSLLIEHPGLADALILSGPPGKQGALRKVGVLASRLEARVTGKQGRSRLVHTLSFGAYNKAFEPARTAYDWLSADPVEVDKYVADPMCGFRASNRLWTDLLTALGDVVQPDALARIPSGTPVLVIAGGMDPVSEAGKTLPGLLDALTTAGLSRVDHRFWPQGRHELLNDVMRDEATTHVLDWIDDALPAS